VHRLGTGGGGDRQRGQEIARAGAWLAISVGAPWERNTLLMAADIDGTRSFYPGAA